MTDEIEQEPAEETAPEVALRPTPAADWPSKGEAGGAVVELPSGGVARLSRPPLQYYIATGRVPPKLWRKVQKEGGEVFADPLNSFSLEELRLFIDWMICCSFIEPVVSMTRKDGTKYIGDLDELDKETVMNLLGLSLAG